MNKNVGIVGAHPSKIFRDILQHHFMEFPEVDPNENIVVCPKGKMTENALCSFIINNHINILLLSDKLYIPEVKKGFTASAHAKKVMQSIVVYFW